MLVVPETNRGSRSLVVGADGQIGRVLRAKLVGGGTEVWGTCQQDRLLPGCLCLELTDDPQLWSLPDAIGTAYLCAAIASQDLCRQDPAGTRHVNVHRTVELARRLAAEGAFVVFLSTSLVFDGSTSFCDAHSPVAPKSEYGRQKAEAERELLSLPNTAVVRLTKVLGPGWPLGKKWRAALESRQPIQPFSDMVMAPVSIEFAVDVPGQDRQRGAEGDLSSLRRPRRCLCRGCRASCQSLGASPSLLQPVTAARAGILPESAPSHTTLDAGRLRAELGLEPPSVWEAIDGAFGLTPGTEK